MHSLPPRDEMVRAYQTQASAYEGVFVTAVTTTGIFCRPTCPARKPKPEHVEFFAAARDALFSGYRPCQRCEPLKPIGEPPEWVQHLIEAVEADPTRRWRDADIHAYGATPEQARRWFQGHHDMTFHAYVRARRLREALELIRQGESVTQSAYAAGYASLSGFNDSFRHLVGDAPSAMPSGPVVLLGRITTPLGPMVAGVTDAALVLLEFADRRMLRHQHHVVRQRMDAILLPGTNEVMATVQQEMDAYFAGDLSAFSIPLEAPGTDFQEAVWRALVDVPYGTSTSYGALAQQLGKPKAVRAVAQANGANRIAILVPCHRVIGKDGTLTGYGGGLWRKRRLLELERQYHVVTKGQTMLAL